jgi:hypothetical protein
VQLSHKESRSSLKLDCRVGFLSFVHNPTPILPKMNPLEILCFPLSRGGIQKHTWIKISSYLHVRKCRIPATNCPPQHLLQKGGQHDNATTTIGNQQSTNAQQQRSNNGRMRQRTTAADKTQLLEKQQWRDNGQATMVGGGGATTALTTTTTKQESINVWWQRWRDDGW